MPANVHELRPKPPETEKITINLGYVDLGHVDLMVYDGFYSNRTDFIRTAFATNSNVMPTMAHNYAINDDVHHQLQGPQGRADVKERSIYTVVPACRLMLTAARATASRARPRISSG